MITHLVLRNFKSFRQTKLALGPLTVLVGTNASGKTNVRDALRFLHGCAQGFTVGEVLDQKWGPGGILQWRGIRGGAVEVAYDGAETLTLGVEIDGTWTYTIELRRDPQTEEPLISLERLGSVDRVIFEAKPIVADIVDVLEVRVPGRTEPEPGKIVGLAGRRYPSDRSVLPRLLQDLPTSANPGLGKELEICRRVRDQLTSLRFLDLDPEAMREPSGRDQHVLGDRGENLSSVLKTVLDDKAREARLLGWLDSLTPADVRDLAFKKDFRDRLLLHLVEGDGRVISADSASDGTLRFLALAAALLSSETGCGFFLEEIDNGIHPTRLPVLLDMLEALGSRGGRQVLATTHNPQLLTVLSDEAKRDAVLIYRLRHSPASDGVRIVDLPEAASILERHDLGRLFASAWLENTVELLADEADREAAV